MTIDEQIIHANHKLGRDEAILDCMSAIEAETDRLYDQMNARRQEIRKSEIYSDWDLQLTILQARKDALLEMHKTLSKL